MNARVVGSSARTHLDECSQELNPLTKFHSSEYDTSLERCLRPEKRPCDGTERWQGQKQYGLHHLTMNLQVHESDQLSLPVRQVASLDMVPERTPCPLHVLYTKFLDTGVDAHTHTHTSTICIQLAQFLRWEGWRRTAR